MPITRQLPKPTPEGGAGVVPMRSAQPAPTKDQSRTLKALPEPEKKKGVFDKVIAEIVKDSRYLTADNIQDLQKLLPVESVPTTNSSGIDLSGLLDTLMKLQRRMQLTGLTSNDPQEIKQMIQSTKVVIDLVSKYQEGISEQQRQLQLENAIVEALDELGNDAIKAKYLAIFNKKLAESGAK